MTGRTIKQIFRTLEETNNVKEVLNDGDLLDIRVYLNGYKEYEGRSWKEFNNHVKERYVSSFAKEMYNQIFCGTNTIKFVYNDEECEVEIYIY